jgi:hypothetical protein
VNILIHSWFELTITVLVEQREGILSLTDGYMTINPDDERVTIDNCGADGSKLAVELRDGVGGLAGG